MVIYFFLPLDTYQKFSLYKSFHNCYLIFYRVKIGLFKGFVKISILLKFSIFVYTCTTSFNSWIIDSSSCSNTTARKLCFFTIFKMAQLFQFLSRQLFVKYFSFSFSNVIRACQLADDERNQDTLYKYHSEKRKFLLFRVV